MLAQAARLLVDSRCTLGEGLTWHPGHAAWFWVDIQERHIWMYRPGDGRTVSWSLPDRAGAFAFTASGRVLVGLAKALVLASLDPDGPGRELEVLHVVDVEPSLPTTRVNDGRPDRAGSFVFGTMDEAADAQAIGAIYQFSAARGLRRLATGAVAIANSICFSPDGGTIYWADSPRRQIMAGRYDAARAAVDEPHVFVDMTGGSSVPDGSIVDAEGCLWNAEWGGSRLTRYDRSGRRSGVVDVAAPHVTCPAFGGGAMTDLATTTARWMMAPEEIARLPESGGLFGVSDVGVQGLAEVAVAGL